MMKNRLVLNFVVTINAWLLAVPFSGVKAQTFSFEVDPEYATTVFIAMNGELKVETWNKPYILFLVTGDSLPEDMEVLSRLPREKLIKKEFGVNDFLFLTLFNLDELLANRDKGQCATLQYTVKVPKYLDLELNCKNDLIFNVSGQQCSQHIEKVKNTWKCTNELVYPTSTVSLR